MVLSIVIFIPCEPASNSAIWLECLIKVDQEAHKHFVTFALVISVEEIIWENSEWID